MPQSRNRSMTFFGWSGFFGSRNFKRNFGYSRWGRVRTKQSFDEPPMGIRNGDQGTERSNATECYRKGED